MRRFLYIFFSVLMTRVQGQSSTATFPVSKWPEASPASKGWSTESLQTAKAFFDSLPEASLVLIDHGVQIFAWGDPAKKIKISSMRKSLLSALFGIYSASGNINCDKTLSSIGIDDVPPLTETEKRATIRMLLEARSGVYHSYVAGTPAMRETQPARGSHLPGNFWYYNNWDFNALGSIFEKETGTRIAEAFEKNLAVPMGMQDFLASDMYYLRAGADAADYEKSIHPAYHFRMSARDLARFGYLYLQRGTWGNRQLVPAKWIKESIQPYSKTDEDEGYGYLWWINGLGIKPRSFSAQGALGKYLIVIPERQWVIVFLNHTEFPDNIHSFTPEALRALPAPTQDQMSHLLNLLLEAGPAGPLGNAGFH